MVGSSANTMQALVTDEAMSIVDVPMLPGLAAMPV